MYVLWRDNSRTGSIEIDNTKTFAMFRSFFLFSAGVTSWSLHCLRREHTSEAR